MKTFTKHFTAAAAVLLLVPCVTWWTVVLINHLIPAGRVLYKLSVYFIPPYLIIESGFQPVCGILMPRGHVGWLATVATYATLALAISFIGVGIKQRTTRGRRTTASTATNEPAAGGSI